jgi:hypothetical protein
MGPYTYRSGENDDWEVYGNSADDDEEPVLDDLLATVQTESLAEVLIACMESGLTPDDVNEGLGFLLMAETGDVHLELLDQHDVLVEEIVLPAKEAALRAAEFVYLQGSDPEEDGAGASPGTIRFYPVQQSEGEENGKG